MRRFVSTLILGSALAAALGAQALPVAGGAAAAKASAAGSSSFASREVVEGRLETPEGRALTAATTADYPVTPGDAYLLAFLKSTQQSSLTLFVETDYSINLAVFGKLDSGGLTFRQLKAKVESLVERAYPGSSPSLILSGTGLFDVMVEGEVGRAGLRPAWGLTRLSEIAAGAGLLSSADRRRVRVRSAKGETREYDLFRAERGGELAQDPYLKPGDLVSFGRAERVVSISGEVRRPGTYQLLPGEGFRELVETYADGFTEQANRERLDLTRQDPGASGLGAKAQLSYALAATFPLLDKDAVAVPSLRELLPVAYFEGALGLGIEGAQLGAANRLPYTYYPGERLSQAVQALRGQFSAVSDISGAYLLRAGERKPIDLGKFLFDKDYSLDLELSPGDVVVVPFRQFFVSVSGAVKLPGRYPYVPDRGWEYYVNLAGGFDKDRNSGEALAVIDLSGKHKAKDSPIQPEDSIVAASNSFLFYFERVSPVVTTIASVASIIAVVASLAQ